MGRPVVHWELWSENPDKAAELRNLLASWRKSVGAKMPTLNPSFAEQGETLR